MATIIKDEIVKISIKLEEYIPLKVLIGGQDEPVEYLSYRKDTASLLEIAVGVDSGFVKGITLLLSKKYDINDTKINIDVYEMGYLKLDAEIKKDCSCFITHLYENGIRIVISKEKVLKYSKMDRLYAGISNLGNIAEICLCPLTSNEINHIKNELDYQ